MFLVHGYGAALARVTAHYLKGKFSSKKVHLFTEGEPASIVHLKKSNSGNNGLGPSIGINFGVYLVSKLDTDIRSTIFIRISGSSNCYKEIVFCKKK